MTHDLTNARVRSIPSTKRRSLAWASPWVGGTLLFLIYVATAVGTVLFVEHGAHSTLLAMSIAAPWLAVGVGVTGALLSGPRIWPALFAGSWVVWGLVVGDPPLSVTIDAVAETGSILVIARLLSVWGFHRSFNRLLDPLILLAAATVGRGLNVAFDLMGGFAIAWLAPDSLAPFYRHIMTNTAGGFPALTPQLVSNSANWAMNSIAGIMLIVPLASLKLEELRTWYLRQPASLIALGVTLSAWTAAALILPMAAARLLLITALMLVAWTAVRFGPPAAAFATLTMSLVATVGVGMRLGPLADRGVIQDIGLQWGFIAVLGLTGLSLTALLAERRRDLEQLKMVADRYQRLFKSNPSPLWVAEPHGGYILMVNDEALRHYGFSEVEFLGMTVAQLNAEPVMPGTFPVGASLDEDETSTVRHRIRAGTTIDVKLLSTPIELDGRPAELCYAVDVTDRYELRSRILASVDLERGRLAQELHDGLGQVLTGLSLGAQAAAVRAARDVNIDGTFIDFLVNNSNQAVRLCRQLTRGVSPLQDANGDLLEALHRLPNIVPPGSGPRLDVEVESQAPLSLSLERSEHLYRVVQEAVTNALKHARAAHICVRVQVTAEVVRVSIADDGVGIEEAARPTNGFGMRSMGLRAAAVGATVEVGPRPGGGTLIRCECPQQERIESSQAGRIAESPAAEAPRMPPVQGKPSPPIGSGFAYLARCLLFAVACIAGLSITVLLATIIDPRLDVNGSRLAIPSFLVGLSVAGLIVGGGRLWPGITFGTLVGALVLLHQPWWYALYYGADITLAALIVLELLTRWRFSRAFDHWQDPLLLFGAAIVGGSVIQALDFVGTLSYQWLRPGELPASVIALITSATDTTPVVTGAFLCALGRWWVDCVAGVVLFVPLLVATPPIGRTLRGKRTEAGFWCLALLGWTACMFMLSEAEARLPLVAMALVLLVWAVVRFGVAMASIATSVCAMAATLSFALQRGVLTTIGVNEGIDTLWGFLALLTVTGMFLTVLLAERNRMLRELAATAQRYRRLFEHDPHPLWVQDAATGRILMVNEQAIRHYGYSESEWLALTCDDLAAKPTIAVLMGLASDYRLVETRHRLKSGAVIDVNLSFAPIDMDGRPTLLCFAVDVTERNALRREFLEATDLERRRLANELRYGFGRTLAELEFAATRLEQAADTGQVDSAAVKLIARTSQRAVEICRQIAHSATNARNPFSEESEVRVSLS
jgi:PAS domain S-box-containing protein